MTHPAEIKCRWNPSNDPWRQISVMKVYRHAQSQGCEREEELLPFLLELADMSYRYGYNFDVMVSMSHLETDTWRHAPWTNHLNPGSIGVTDSQDFGYHWDTGEDAAKAMVAHFSAYVSGWNQTLAVDGILSQDPRYFAVYEANYQNSVTTVNGFGSGRWASDPDYARKVAGRYDMLRQLR